VIRKYLPDLYEQFCSFAVLALNIHSVFEKFNQEIKRTKVGSLIAAEVTNGLEIKTASALTGYAKSTLYKAINTNQQNDSNESTKEAPIKTSTNPTKKVSDEENFFEEWSWQVAPRGHSNDAKRRFVWITWHEAHEEYNKAAMLNGAIQREATIGGRFE
jgi:hypothetical protein